MDADRQPKRPRHQTRMRSAYRFRELPVFSNRGRYLNLYDGCGSLRNSLDQARRQCGLSRSEIVRRAVGEYIDNHFGH